MAVDWEKSIAQWRGLELNALSAVQSMQSVSLCLINSIMSERLHPSTSNIATPTCLSTTFQTVSASLVGSTPLQTESLVGDTLLSENIISTPYMDSYAAFWSLLLIYSYTWLQVCARVCGIQKGFTFLVCSSPVFCLVDTLTILSRTLYHTRRKGLRSAIRFVAASRGQHSTPPRMNQTIISGTLLAVSQVIFLSVMSSIPGTQFAAACYVFTYWANFVLNKYGKPQLELDEVNKDMTKDANVGDNEKAGLTAILATAGQVVWWTVVLKGALPKDMNGVFGEKLTTVLLCAGFLVVVIFPVLAVARIVSTACLFVDVVITFSPAAIMLYLFSLHPRPGWPSIIELTTSAFGVTEGTANVGIGSMLALAWLVLHIYTYPFFLVGILGDYLHSLDHVHSGSSPVDFILTLTPYGIVLTFILLAAVLSYLLARVVLFGKLAHKLGLRHRSIASDTGWAYLCLFATNIGSARLYYTKVYGLVPT